MSSLLTWNAVRHGKVNGHHLIAADASPSKPSAFCLGLTETVALANQRITELENALRQIESFPIPVSAHSHVAMDITALAAKALKGSHD